MPIQQPVHYTLKVALNSFLAGRFRNDLKFVLRTDYIGSQMAHEEIFQFPPEVPMRDVAEFIATRVAQLTYVDKILGKNLNLYD